MHDDLEHLLRGLKLRPAPPAWRREILAACAEEKRNPGLSQLLRFLYPGPVPTTALVALWLLILGFFLDTPPAPKALGRIDLAATREAAREREAILVQLNDPDGQRGSGASFALPLRPHGG